MSISRWTCIWLTLLAAAPLPLAAQGHGSMPGHGQTSLSPHAGMGRQAVKALSAQQMADLETGRGMGLALTAEVNGHPGPTHVLELADALGLSHEQRARTRVLLDAMKAETVPIGMRVVAEEAALDRLFAQRHASRPLIAAATARIGRVQGELRAAHLGYHLVMMEVLSPQQVTRYGELRGHATPGPTP